MKKGYKSYLTMLLIMVVLVSSINLPIYAVEEPAQADHVIISQVYGGGGNSGAPLSYDFIELYNPTNATVDLAGWSVQYASSTGSFADNRVTILTGTLEQGEYYLIQENPGSNDTIPFPTANVIGSISMSAKNGKVALVNNSAIIGSKTDISVVDFVGYGSANEYEGGSATPAASNTQSVMRKIEGVDTDNNGDDFEKVDPNPRNNEEPVVITQCATPTASKASGPVVVGTDVMFTTTTVGAVIEYNTTAADAADWIVGDTVTITEDPLNPDITYFVRATKDDLDTSEVAMFTYTATTYELITIAEAKDAVVDTENLMVEGVITYIGGQNVYVQDDSGAICLRLSANLPTGQTVVEVGNKIKAVGKRGFYKGVIQLGSVDFDAVELISEDNEIPVTDSGVTIAGILNTPEGKTVGFDYMCEFVKVSKVIVTEEGVLSQEGFDLPIYRAIDLAEYEGLALNDTVDVVLRVNAYNNKVQAEVISLVEVEPKTIKEVLELPSGTNDVFVQGQIAYFATSYGNPVIQSVIDGEVYSLYLYGANIEGAKIGDIVNVEGTYKIHYGMREISFPGYSRIVESAPAMEPVTRTIAEINALEIFGEEPADNSNPENFIGQFVKIENVTLGEHSDYNTPISDATGSINIYKAIEYQTMVEQGDVVDLYAMVARYVNKSGDVTIQLFTGSFDDNGFFAYDVVNDTKPPLLTLPDSFLNARAGEDYYISVEAKDNKGIAAVVISYSVDGLPPQDIPMGLNPENGRYEFIIPGFELPGFASNLEFSVRATDVTGLNTQSAPVSVAIDNSPVITSVTPGRNTSTGDVKDPVISVEFENAGLSPLAIASIDKEGVGPIHINIPMVPNGPQSLRVLPLTLEDGKYTVTVIITRDDGESVTETWTFTVGTPDVQAYFGQLHSHTAEFSDGSGTLDDALNYMSNISVDDNVDFVGFTDHSNYFDSKDAPSPAGALNDKTLMTTESLAIWNNYVSKMDDFNTSNAGNQVALAGFEMTWSGGPGHINTFNSDGLISRNNEDLNNKNDDLGLKAYYETLIQDTDPLANLSQFNHPGKTFGSFSDFAYWNPLYDNKMVAVEVGNGEGAIGSGGYFTSYAEYTKALDKGWHVAPTNNQDNHKGNWGNSNTARTVIITDDLSTEGLYTGLKDMSVYATEDKNLNINYTVNDVMLGTIISDVPTDPLRFNVQVSDDDVNDNIARIDIVTNGGLVAKSETFSSNLVDWSFELPSIQGYYYVRVTQADKNIAVTAPIWIGQAPLVGINSFEVDTKMPVTNEELTLTATLFNNEETPVTVNSIQYTSGGTVIGSAVVNAEMVSTGTYSHSIKYTPTVEGEEVITLTVECLVNGQVKTFTKNLELNIHDSEKLVYVGIDASHFNEYVDGNYKDSMGNFANMAIEYGIRVVELNTSEELIAATNNDKYAMLIFTPPTRRDGSKSFLIGYKNYLESEIDAIKTFAESGRTVIVSGWGDYYESYEAYSDGTPYTLPAEDHMSVQQNRLLEAIGSNLRISDDEIKDDVNNGGQAQRLYLAEYNMSNMFLNFVKPTEQVYSNYGGATIYGVDALGQPTTTLVDTISPMVYSHETGNSIDEDSDGTTGIPGVLVPKYSNKYLVAASEDMTYANGNSGTIIASGSVFMSNFEVQVSLDSYSTPEYSNYTILENILAYINPVTITDIKDVHAAEEGQTFTIQGIATSNASGFDKDTAFFDCIYVQDATGGINAFPVSGTIQAGQTVMITGKTSSYQGERQLSVEEVIVINEEVEELPTPKTITVLNASMGMELGSLVTVEGSVESFEVVNGVVEHIIVKDKNGNTCRVFIDGYITSDKIIANLEVGADIKAVGLMSVDTLGKRIRIRDRDDIMCLPINGDIQIEVKTPDGSLFTGDIEVYITGEEVRVFGPIKVVEGESYLPGELFRFGTKNVYIAAINQTHDETIDPIENEVIAVNCYANSKFVEITRPTDGSSYGIINFQLQEVSLYGQAVNGIGEVQFNSIIGMSIFELESLVGQDLTIMKPNSNGYFYLAPFNELFVPNPLQPLTFELTPIEMFAWNLDNNMISTPGYELLFNKELGVRRLDFVCDKYIPGLPLVALSEVVLAPEWYAAVDLKLEATQTPTNPSSGGTTTPVIINDNILPEGIALPIKFTDINGWYVTYVNTLSSKGIMKGKTSNIFDPTGVLTRAEAVQILANLAGADLSKQTIKPFDDVELSAWYGPAISWAKENGLAKGYKGEFSPLDQVSRQDFSVLITRYMEEYLGKTFVYNKDAVSFEDHNSISLYALKSVESLQRVGILNGNTYGQFLPKTSASRAEAAKIIAMLMELE